MNNAILQANLEKLLAEFDFTKVYKTMKALNWTWAEHGRIPTISEMKDAIRREHFAFMWKAKKNESILGGGFEMTYLGDNRLKLTFQVAWAQTESLRENE